MTSKSTFEPAVRLDDQGGAQVRRRRRALYQVTTVFLVLFVGAAVVDGVGALDVYGVDTAQARARGDGYELDVRYATVTRPRLATPFEIRVRQGASTLPCASPSTARTSRSGTRTVEPAVQRSERGEVSVVDDESVEFVAVEFTTVVLP